MESIKVKTKSGKDVYICKLEEGEATFSKCDGQGMCVACGEFTDGVEPDARRYECDSCGQPRVYGIEELVIMGYCR